ncbi:MAG TPA: phage holin family protein [Humidesulfovibrio sp.]|uniref:phage holin family protein n=1 Tax=Humidesulfovibrio sp. TaxID=2910988 RepID=UPI002BF8861F|nr:phage holin family protein [Humidesulfovibrio sp.]HWR02784.1 phage holin family protein [Humidesulfovibrio sp.]
MKLQLLEDLDLGGTSGRVAGALAQTLKDRIELLGLELREDKIRLVQVLILACCGVVFALLGLILAVLTLLALLPAEWRAVGMGVMAGACLVSAAWAFAGLKRRLTGRGQMFAQTLAELEKDKACF